MPPHTTTFTRTTPDDDDVTFGSASAATGAPPQGWMYLCGKGIQVMESRVYQVFAVATQFKTSLLVQAKRMSTRLKMIYTRCHVAIVVALFCSFCIYGLGASILRGTTVLLWLCVAMVSHILLDAASFSVQLLASLAFRVVEKVPDFLVFGNCLITNATHTITSATAYSFDAVCFVADYVNSETVGLMMGGFIILHAGLSCCNAPHAWTIRREDQIGVSSTRTRNRQIVR